MLMRTAPLYLQDLSHPQARACAQCAVRRDALFGVLDADGLERIHAHIAAPRVEPEALLYARGRPAEAIYTIRAGIVRFERATETGERRILRLAGRGDLIGQEALLHQPYADDVVACTPVEVCRIPQVLVDELGARDPALTRELMRRWQQAVDDGKAWSSDLCSGPARRRLLKLLQLLQRHADDQDRIWLPRREDIGDMLDVTVETASRLVSQLRREAVLTLLPPRLARLDAQALQRALADGDV
jgi:CRP-like cAMP-binding protein